MAWPIDDLTTVHLDAGTDDPSQARLELLALAQKVQAIIAGAVSANVPDAVVKRDGSGNFTASLALTKVAAADGTAILDNGTDGTDAVLTGSVTGYANTQNSPNTANGYQALYSTTVGSNNTANGDQALYSNTEGYSNTANGYQALFSSTIGSNNTANGYQALYSTTTGDNNTANGYQALYSNTTANTNTATGSQALVLNTTGYSNTANGYSALRNNSVGINNTATGHQALFNNTTAYNNTANGDQALYANTTGSNNTADGERALYSNTTGSGNTAIGSDSLYYNTTGNTNTAIGNSSDGSTPTVNNEFTLGAANVTNLRCNDTTISGLSDERDKAEITDLPSTAGVEFINKLRPVTFYWDRREDYEDMEPDGSQVIKDVDPEIANTGQRMGFIAQEVLAAIQGHKYMEDSGVVQTNNPDRLEFAPAHLVTPLIKAVQELSARVEELESQLNTSA